MAIVKANFVCRAKGAVKAAVRAAAYYTYRDGADQAERVWHTRDGRSGALEDFKQELRDQAATWGYTYRVVLSTKDADLPIADYAATLGERFEHWYLITHHNTDYPHAHVIGFTKKQMRTSELFQMRGRLLEYEQARAQEQAQGRDQARTQDQARDQGQQPQVQPRTRDQGIDMG